MLDKFQNNLSGYLSLSYEVRNRFVCETRVFCPETERYVAFTTLQDQQLVFKL
jgi:hypothetical protein